MVRVTLESPQKKAALISLTVAGIAAATVLAGYWVWHQDEESVAAQRELTDIILPWRCPKGHVFEMPGDYSARPCPTCQQPARPQITYQCPKDGEFVGSVMYDPESRRLTAVHFGAGEWIPVTQSVPCPRCGGEVRPKQRGPFDRPTPAPPDRP